MAISSMCGEKFIDDSAEIKELAHSIMNDSNKILEVSEFYDRICNVVSPMEWAFHAPYVAAIQELKKVRQATILAHNYQTPEIFNCVADIVGDSLQLAIEATKTNAEVIIQCGVHFMAETAKVLNPDKVVIIPDLDAGCSLASSINGNDVAELRKKYPGVPIVTYVNTSAEVKAMSDICCTSSNAVQIVEKLGCDRVLVIPDEFLAKYVASRTSVEILSWHGVCEVHEQFTAKELEEYRYSYPGVKIVAHPECSLDVINEADFSGSTSAMISWVKKNKPEKVALITECSMADNVASMVPNTEFIRPCNLCPHMKRITLPRILDSLINLGPEVKVEESVLEGARRSVEAMIDITVS